MELEIKLGLELLEKNRRLTSAGLNPIEPSPATTGLMNFQWKLQHGPVGIKVHLMVSSGKQAVWPHSPIYLHQPIILCYFRNQNCTAKNSYVCEKNKNTQSSSPAPGSNTATTTTTEGTQTTTTPAPPTASCNCGLINRQSRIVGGVETSANKYPWMVRGHGDCQ